MITLCSILAKCFLERVNGYTIHEKIGYGSYGDVYKVSKGKKMFALKRIIMTSNHEDILRVLREVRVLKFLRSCPQSVMLVDGWMDKNNSRANLILEHFDYDLNTVINGYIFSELHVRVIARQLFVGLAYMHSAGIIHRDIKSANILINLKDCRTVICDYNLATRAEHFDEVYARSHNVVSRWYRAPELLLNRPYSSKIDIWAAGCVIYELATSSVLWAGISDKDQLRKICATLQPTKDDYDEMFMNSYYSMDSKDDKLFVSSFSDDFNDFIHTLLCFSHTKRSSAFEALQHPWLSSISEPKLHLSEKIMSSIDPCEKHSVGLILSKDISSIKTSFI